MTTSLIDSTTSQVRRPERPGAWTALGRSLLLRCPACGERRVRRTYFDFAHSCPACGLRFDRGESDYWIGGFMLNFVVAELIVVVAFVGAIVLMWPDVPWDLVMWGALVPAVLGPMLAYPFSRNVWLALDLKFRPPESEDFEDGVAVGDTGGEGAPGAPGAPETSHTG